MDGRGEFLHRMRFDKPRRAEIGLGEAAFDRFFKFGYLTPMNDTPQDAWFYSHEGERIGPVTFAELQIKAKEGALNPRLDLVWKYGMDQWQASGEVEGLFERRAPEERAQTDGIADVYKPETDESVEEKMSREGNWPGSRRREFLAALILFPVLWGVGLSFLAPILEVQFGPQIMSFVKIGAPLLPLIIGIVFGVKRLHNLGMSGWWLLGNLVPLLNLWVGFRCFACPAGYAYHKKMDGIGVFLGIIYWLLVLFSILVVAATIALLLGMIGSPEVHQKLQDAIQQAMERMPKQ